MKHDALSVIEAAYDLDADEQTWLANVSHAAYRALDLRDGMQSFVYRITPEGSLHLEASAAVDLPTEVAARILGVVERLPPGYVDACYRSVSCSTASHAGPPEAQKIARQILAGRDVFVVNGIDPTGRGVCVSANLGKITRPSRKAVFKWSRVAAHLAAGHRLRRRLGVNASAIEDADALFRPGGRFVHATGEAQQVHAQEMLRVAAAAIDRSRSRRGRADEPEAVDAWKGLVAAKWTLLDHFESDGQRYIIARKNDPSLEGLAALTPRERQVLGYIALGHPNKLTAYELGIAPSTVSVLLHRAARKLGAKSRAQLVEIFRRSSTNGAG